MIADIIEVNGINGGVLAIVYLADLKEIASFALIALSIGYTIWKWRHDAKNKKGKDE